MFYQRDRRVSSSSEEQPFISATVTAGLGGVPEQSSGDGTSKVRAGTIKNVGGLKKDGDKAISAGDGAQSLSRFGKGLFNLVHGG